MAKKKPTSDPKAETTARIKRTEAYAEKVRLMFAATVNQILALNKSIPKLQPGEMFSFDSLSLKKQNEVERLLRQLHSVATMAIQQGITLEWSQANAAADALVKSVFGQAVLSTPEFKAWGGRNGAAMEAFINRSEKGLNLSDRVWKAVRQLRDEMEVAITVSIGEGESARKMSQAVRKYLNDPDLMFRRFRYKAGEEIVRDDDGNEIGKKIIWGKKWKKRIRKPDGTYGWIDYDRDAYKTGAGVYKSSAKNAMRVARTETNIAYRRADHERWQAMDFVLGQRVSMSKDHPKKDICDKLAGDYPKDFVFDGWHPQCFCYVTPITIPPEETAKLTEMMLNGEDWRSELERLTRGREITSYPDNFKQWVTDNAANIQAARDRGTEPYFIKNNKAVVDELLNGTHVQEEKHVSNPESERIEANRRDYERLKADPDYTDVEFNPENGGLKATHVGHEDHSSKDSKKFFEKFTTTDLEKMCQDVLFKNGYSCILANEHVFDNLTGKQLTALDSITNGNYVDIFSITKNGKNTISNGFKRKKKQLIEFNELYGSNLHQVIIFFYESDYYDENTVKSCLGQTIKEAIVVFGNGKVFKISKK